MNNILRWVLALGVAGAGVFGGATGLTTTTADDAPLGQIYEVAGHEEDDERPGDESGKGDEGHEGGDGKDDDGGGGDDDPSDVNDTDGPGDDEDD